MAARAYCDCHVNIWNAEHVLPLYERQLARVRQGEMAPRADADTKEARSGDTAPRDTALAGGAQAVSTDYLEPDPRFGTTYHVEMRQGAAAACDPLRRPERCAGLPVEPLTR